MTREETWVRIVFALLREKLNEIESLGRTTNPAILCIVI